MARKLFCELSPTCYKISVEKEKAKRNILNYLNKSTLAKEYSKEELPNIVKGHTSLILRKLHNVDMQLQKNKKKNLQIASKKINGLIIHPGEIFSFWYIVGETTRKYGYKDGLVISKTGLTKDIGGGLCQLANMIHYLVLNSPLEVVELHHHSDALFPDDRRRVPFGTGTSVFYNYLDYRFKNTTNQDVQLLLWVQDDLLYGELRSNEPFPYRYKLVEENHHFQKEKDKYYRISQVYKITIDKSTNEEIKKELILNNHSEVMYDYNLIPEDEIRNEEITNNLLDVLKDGKDKILYKVGNQQITYEEAYNMVLELSNNLKKQGTSPIIVYGHKSISQFISILSCVVAKRCYIPIDLCTPISRIKEIIKKTNCKLVIENEKLEIDDIECLTIDKINKKYKSINNEYPQDNKFAYIIFTSGSTGNSKGVPITYRNLNNFITWIITRKEYKNCKNLNILSQASFSFDLSVMDIYFSIYKNNTIISIEDNTNESINNIYNTLKNEKINFLIMTPTFVKMLLIENDFNDKNYKDIKYMFFCGECLETKTAQKIKERFPHVLLINAYGPTEATCCISQVEITNNMLKEDYLPVGKVDDSAVKVEIEKKEIILKGKSVFSGYLSLDSDSCYKENNVNCYKTKDVGEIKNNYIYCIGRLDNQIKYQGYRIELGDIENNLLKLKEIREAVVIVKYKEKTNIVKLLKAFVVLNEKIEENEIKEKLSKLLPHYMIPKTIEVIDKIPINKNGKYDRKKLSKL